MELYCQIHPMYILHKTFNDLLVCDKCCEEIRDDEKIIKRRIENEKSNHGDSDNI